MTDSTPLRILFDISQQAHVHLFKHAIHELERLGHETMVASRNKGVTTALLDASGIDHRPISKHRPWSGALVPEWALREHRLIAIAREFDPDVVVSQFTPCATHAARLANARSIIFSDDESATDVAGTVTHPFATLIYTPQAFTTDLGPKHRRYDGYHELAYLRPSRFERDPSALQSAGIDPDQQYFVCQFDAWEQPDEGGTSGFSPYGKRDLLDFLDQHGTVYVESPADLPSDLPVAELPVPAPDVHHLLAFADLYVGDSRTMALEAGTLGTPSIWSWPESMHRPGHVRELDTEYSLVLSFESEHETVVTAKNLAVDPKARERWAGRRDQLLGDTVDVTGFMVDVIHQQGTAAQTQELESLGQEPTYELV